MKTIIHTLALALLVSPAAQAFDFQVGGSEARLDNLVTIGALIRMQERNDALIGKSNLNPGLCVRRTAGTFDSPDRAYAGDTCTTGGDGSGNARALAAPGSLNPNGDNGNLNFDRHDIVHASAKVTSDLSFNLGEYGFFARGLALFDQNYSDFDEHHPDTTAQPARTKFSADGEDRIGINFELLDWFVTRHFDLGERELSVKLGRQVLNWGESAFIVGNSLNTINPPNAALLRVPGFDIKELAQPVGMLTLGTDLWQGANLQLFYQYEWRPVVLDPVGSFFSTADILGDGATYAMLGFAKAPEDPLGLYEPWRNPQDSLAPLGSSSSRTVQRNFAEEKRREPDDGGQYGASLKLFLEDLNNGTELAFYYANYHSRIPAVSALAAQDSCVPASSGNAALNLANLLRDCQIPLGNLVALAQHQANPEGAVQYAPAGREVLPVDTVSLFAEYPENIRLYGVSFNTTFGDYAFSGEATYRPNLPVQLQSTDIVFAALQPAIPEQPYDIGLAVLPGRREAAPDFVASNFRGQPPRAGDYVRGWEPMKLAQLDLTLLRTFGGGQNPIGASQIVLLLEAGWTHVFDMSALDELQFSGAIANTHISAGGDGSAGINPRDIRSNPADPASNRSLPNQRQNPIAQDGKAFGTADSFGYRLVASTRYDDALFGGNIELLTALFHDVHGVAPGLGQNFVEGRKQAIAGLRFDYLSKYSADVRYTWYFGGELLDGLLDRDNLSIYFGYLF
ncbi:MAG TPA: DUF1302 domain-containing protein [Solimonas sp.]|nr:DUF1302 domain-containing protein [Solimonas sp.]